MPIRAQGRPVHRSMIAVAGHVGRVAVEGKVGDEAGSEVGLGRGNQTKQGCRHQKHWG